MLKFGTGGFRGIIADDFNKENLSKIAQALSEIYHDRNYQQPIYVGYDFRFISGHSAQWICSVLAANGIKVILSNYPNTTPEVMFICKDRKSELGIMITASHNPYYYNGVKVFQKDGMDADISLTSLIEQKINSMTSYNNIDFLQAIEDKKIEYINLLPLYMKNIANYLRPTKENNLKVLIDPIYGTGSITLKKLSKLMKIKKVSFVNSTINARFGGLLPNPTLKNMNRDKDIVLKGQYDLAVGTDSDCDRLGVLDENGNYVDANEILASLYYYLVKYRGLSGDIVKNIATSNLIDKVAEKMNFKAIEVDVGFKNISFALRKYNALIGGESSGGLTIKDYIYGKDSTFSCALFLEMVSEMGKSVSSIIKEIREFAGYYYIIMEDEMRFINKENILNGCEQYKPKFNKKIIKINHLNNNYKYYFEDDSWALIRFSGTEPLVRIFVEMPIEEEGLQAISTIKEFINEHDQKESDIV